MRRGQRAQSLIRRPRRFVAGTLAAGTLISGGFVGFAALPASADSVSNQITSAKAQLNALDNQAEAASERYNAARIKLQAAEQSAQAAQDKLSAAQARVATLRTSVTTFAVAAYRGDDTFDSMLSIADGSPQSFIDRVSSLQAVSESQDESLAEVAAAARTEEQAQSDAKAALAASRAATQAMQADRNQVIAAANKEKSILGSLEAREQAIIRAARAAAARAAAERAAAAIRAREQATTTATQAVEHQPSVSPPTHVQGSGGAKIAVEWAYKELGKPYVWGAAGPNSFDCSGLTMYVWGKAGVALDHYTGAQWNEGEHVSQSQLEPGDLVFFGSDLHHVGLYIGGGNMIEAPYTGADVRISPYDRPDYAGAVRPGV